MVLKAVAVLAVFAFAITSSSWNCSLGAENVAPTHISIRSKVIVTRFNKVRQLPHLHRTPA